MVVQPRGAVLRCFAQAEHARVSGALASRWSTPSRPAVPRRLVEAIAAHDIGWLAADLEPVLDAARARPFDFMTLPAEERVAIYATGVDTLEELDPFAGFLASIHFSGFVDARANPRFPASEDARRARLIASGAVDPESIPPAYALLQQLDLLSLILCLAPPGSDPEAHPPWLRDRLRVDGVEHTVRWDGAWSAALEPSPFPAPVTLDVTYVDLPRSPYATQRALSDAWATSPPCVWRLSVR